MLIRSPSLLFAKYTSFQSISPSASGSATSLKRKRESTRQCIWCRSERKTYATIAGDDPQHHGEQNEGELHAWPKPLHGQVHPTPYQIFEMKTSAAYSKARFYELVKLYHPDRNGEAVTIPRHVKMERYRLVVAANHILSDQTRRSAYDRFGAGWNGKAEAGGRETWYQPSPSHPPGPFSQSWTDPRNPIWQNATWEDWERFYKRRAKEEGTTTDGVRQPRQNGLYLQNSYFLLLVMIFALMGSTANYNRAQDAGQYFVEQRDIVHDRAAKELRKVRQEASGSGNRQDRIEWFIRNREATLGLAGSDPETLRQEKADRLLPDRQICRSEEIAEKD